MNFSSFRQVHLHQVGSTDCRQTSECMAYRSWGSVNPVWCFRVSVQTGLLFSVHRAAYTADAATSEGRAVTRPYSMSAISAKKKIICSSCVQQQEQAETKI